MLNCNPQTGACELPAQASAVACVPLAPAARRAVVRYIGDPMCSWCWGMSPVLEKLAAHCAQEGLDFSLTMGGLRAGGGDPWNDAFKKFLRHEWNHIAQTTGQPFGYTLLDAPLFNYDTEPACRAVAVAQQLLAPHGEQVTADLAFFAAVQRKFYVDGADPKEPEFYRSICDERGIHFETFRALFASGIAKMAVQAQFEQARIWGVRAFPSLLVEVNGQISSIAAGYITADDAIARVASVLAAGR